LLGPLCGTLLGPLCALWRVWIRPLNCSMTGAAHCPFKKLNAQFPRDRRGEVELA